MPHCKLPHHCSLFLRWTGFLFIPHCSKPQPSFSAFQVTHFVLGVLKTTLRFDNSLRRTNRTQHIIILTVSFTTAKEYKAKINKGKGVSIKVQRKPGASLQESLLREDTRDVLNSISNVVLTTCIYNGVYQESSLDGQCPKFLPRAHHVGLLYLACTQTPDSQKENRYSV